MSNGKNSKSNSSKDKTKRIKTVNEDAKTKKMKTVSDKNEKKKGKTKNKKGKHPKLMLCLKIILALFIIGAIILGGVIAGVIFGLFGDDLKITEETFAIETRNTILLDINGNEIATLNGDENREVITLNEMGEYLPKAFVSIEDERFYSHSGVDILRTTKATLNYLTGDSSYGGSTITQQLVKNATGDKDKSPIRKITEIIRAYQTERIYSKDQILEAYLNTIPLGGGGKNVYGVEVAAKYYFDKKPAELTVAEAAYIAGITHSPNVYNPFKETPNTDKIKTRTKVVLGKMKELGKIDEAQYNEAVATVEQGLAFKEGTITSNNALTQHEEAALDQVVTEYAKATGLEYKVALTKIKGGGYKIYTTENKAIQTRLEEEYAKTKYIDKGHKKKADGTLLNDDHTQSSMTIIDQSTGYVVGCIGVLGEKTAYGLNRAISEPHQPGSSIKPLATIAPSLQEGIITAATVVDDTPKSWGGYNPHNAYSGYKGLLNIRKMIELSSNVPEVKLMQKLTPAKSVEYLKKFGLNGVDTTKDAVLSTALGGLTYGTTTLEMASAYAAIANGGEYIEPTFYTKVEDSNGKVILEATQERRRVLSEQNAYILQSILKEPLNGTASKARISGVEVRAKTGSTDDFSDRWLCGFTPYYTAATWFGYKNPEPVTLSGKANLSMTIWQAVMKDIHVGLSGKSFEKPSGLVNAVVCKDSGLLATDLCSQDPRGARTYSEIFAKGTVPSKSCSTHVKVKICKETGKLANEFCKDVEERVCITRDPNDTSWKSAADAQYMAPTETCTTHTKAPDTTKPVITLNGEEKVTLKLKAKYEDKGATAKDDVDGDITDKIKIEIKKDGKVVDKVDTSKAGTYTITYTVSDTAGNTATKTRTVIITDSSNTNTTANTTNTTTTTDTVNTTKK